MKLKIIFICTFLLPFVLIFCKKISATEALVYCSDKNKNWRWLNNGKKIVKGSWGIKNLNNDIYFIYFILDNGSIELEDLKSKCIKEFGNEFIYAQPFNPYSNLWIPFSLNNNQIMGGHITLQYRQKPYLRFG